jgi:polysaccharide pyruvyl transferase WcaK-like protein
MFGLRLDYPSFVHGLVDALLRETDGHILLVPHTYAPADNPESDPEACLRVTRTVPDRWRDRVHLVKGAYDQFELKGIIGQCDFFIGSRMHACIAALSQGIPTVGISYSHKFTGVFDAVGMGAMVLDAREADGETAQWRLLRQFKESVGRSGAVRDAVGGVRGMVKETFRALLTEELEREVLVG